MHLTMTHQLTWLVCRRLTELPRSPHRPQAAIQEISKVKSRLHQQPATWPFHTH